MKRNNILDDINHLLYETNQKPPNMADAWKQAKHDVGQSIHQAKTNIAGTFDKWKEIPRVIKDTPRRATQFAKDHPLATAAALTAGGIVTTQGIPRAKEYLDRKEQAEKTSKAIPIAKDVSQKAQEVVKSVPDVVKEKPSHILRNTAIAGGLASAAAGGGYYYHKKKKEKQPTEDNPQ